MGLVVMALSGLVPSVPAAECTIDMKRLAVFDGQQTR